jgi:hypothetical protein
MRYLLAVACASILATVVGCGSQAVNPTSASAISIAAAGTRDYYDDYPAPSDPYDPYPPSPAPVPPTAPTPSGTLAVAPSVGPTTGSTPVTITGGGFAAGATVMFGAAAATDVAVVDGSTMTVMTPPSASGWVDVVIAVPGGSTFSLPGGFTYADEPAPGTIATITITPGGTSPKAVQVAVGSIVRLVNNDVRPHALESDPHPTHTDCPEANGVGLLVPGGSGQTRPLPTARTCGIHDHNDPGNPAWTSRIIIR